MGKLSISLLIATCALGLGSTQAPAAGPNSHDARTAKPNRVVRADEAKPRAIPSTNRYYIEFRVGAIGLYGHSYIAYGRLDARGQPADARYADRHPVGNYALMALGHLVPVPANTEWDPDVLKLKVTSSYRRHLNASEYGRLLAAIQRARATKQVWSTVNNCNHFVGELAAAIGLRVPNDFQVSYTFIPALKEINEAGGETRSPHPPTAAGPNQVPAPVPQPRT